MTFYIGGNQRDRTFAGYHSFCVTHHNSNIIEFGSFEVFYHVGGAASLSGDCSMTTPGWYWWPCFPGCVPDGDATGPYPTAEGAYLNAIGD